MKYKAGHIRNEIITRLRVLLKKQARLTEVQILYPDQESDEVQADAELEEQWRKLIRLLERVPGNCKKVTGTNV